MAHFTQEQIAAAARALADHSAASCNVDPQDNWNLYSIEFTDDAHVALAALAQAAPQAAQQDDARDLVGLLRSHHKLEIWCWDDLLVAADMIESLAAQPAEGAEGSAQVATSEQRKSYIKDMEDTLSQIGTLVGVSNDADALITAVRNLATPTAASKAPVAAAPVGWRERLTEMRDASYTISQYPETAQVVFDSVIDALDELAAAEGATQADDAQILAEARRLTGLYYGTGINRTEEIWKFWELVKRIDGTTQGAQGDKS